MVGGNLVLQLFLSRAFGILFSIVYACDLFISIVFIFFLFASFFFLKGQHVHDSLTSLNKFFFIIVKTKSKL